MLKCNQQWKPKYTNFVQSRKFFEHGAWTNATDVDRRDVTQIRYTDVNIFTLSDSEGAIKAV
jgi:hypothetical protein